MAASSVSYVGHAELHRRLAAAVAFAARRLWRRASLSDADTVILDLLVEALHRMGHEYRAPAGQRATQCLQSAPQHVVDIVARLGPLAQRRGDQQHVDLAPPGGVCREERGVVDKASGQGESSPATIPRTTGDAACDADPPGASRVLLPLVGGHTSEWDESDQEIDEPAVSEMPVKQFADAGPASGCGGSVKMAETSTTTAIPVSDGALLGYLADMALAQVQVTNDGLIDWYLVSVASDIQSERQLDEQARLVQLIINKLIDQERICVDGKGVLSSPGWEPTRDEREMYQLAQPPRPSLMQST